MAEEIKQECFIDIPTRDYCTPDPKLLDRGLTQGICLALCGVPLYTGCLGKGKNRPSSIFVVVRDSPTETVRRRREADCSN